MNKAKELLEKYFKNECTEDEKRFLEHWFHHYNLDADSSLTAKDYQLAREKFERSIRSQSTSRRNIIWYAAAAAIFFIVSVSLFFVVNKSVDTHINLVQHFNRNVNKPLLVVNESKEISLLEVNKNIEEVAKITDDEGRVVYSFENKKKGFFAKAKINTILTPAQQTLKAKLPDGSFVWLNGNSQISFISNFNDNEERVVHLKGEAYFEVAKNPDKPFKVTSEDQTVQVLGTHFNVKVLKNKTLTSLLEGSIALSPNKLGKQVLKPFMLKPGQQAITMPNRNYNVSNFDVDKILDWKYGDFIFKEDSLGEIAAKLSEWYAVNFSFEDETLKVQTFSGRLSRSNTLAEALLILEKSCEIKFNKNGKLNYTLSNIEPNNKTE